MITDIGRKEYIQYLGDKKRSVLLSVFWQKMDVKGGLLALNPHHYLNHCSFIYDVTPLFKNAT